MTGTGERAIFIPIDPCRLADARPAPNTVGPRTAGLGPADTYTIDGWGAQGNCTLPSGTAALALNVTAVGATQQTNLRFFPTGTPLPTTANLNPTPGAPPTPNAVTVSLNDAGKFSVYNAFGTVAVIVDVVGVYDDHHHDDRYYTKEQVDQSIADFGNSFVVAVTVGNGEGVGNSVCSGAGTEIKARNARGQLVDTRFSFIVPGYAYGQVRGDGSIRSATSELSSVEHPATGEYCLVFAGAQPSQIQQEATVASVTAES